MTAAAKPPRPAPAAPAPLPVPVVDNHCHLDLRRDGDGPGPGVAALLAEAAAVGVDRVVHLGIDVASSRMAVALAHEHPALLAGVAIHPNEAPRLAARGELQAAWAQIEALAADPRTAVIGETGLDYHRTGPPGRPAQHESFRWHIDLAKRTGRALQIHDRDAHDDVLAVLEQEGAPDKTVFHCFSGGPAMAATCVERGYHLSFPGTITFPNAHRLRDALALTPLDRVLVETDAPFLTPAPHRGAGNAPYLVPLTVRAMAEVLDTPLEVLCRALSENAERLYGPW